MEKIKNVAYIDSQNLHMGTEKNASEWKVDLARFRIYLQQKYDVDRAYYYLGYVQDGGKIDTLYESIQAAGFILVFRQHNSAMVGKKKGNVDSDIIFSVMQRLVVGEEFNKIVLVSGDGDYKMLVDFLIERGKFEKILFPNRKFRSSLYKSLASKYFTYLDDEDIKRKIEKSHKQKEKLP